MTANRETWLESAAALIAAERFEPAGYSVPKVRVSTGFPFRARTSRNSHAIGQCWTGEAAADGLAQLFLSPIIVDTVIVAATLAHEMAHATVGVKHGHNGTFKRCALAIGLQGKMTATVASDEFQAWVADRLVPVLGEYPHAELRALSAGKKQSTRMVKCECEECGYVARTTAKWLHAIGAPLCACNNQQMSFAIDSCTRSAPLCAPAITNK